MKAKQLSVFLENKGGRLMEVTAELGKAGINLSAMSIADNSDFGILRCIVSEPERAYDVLKAAGFAVKLTDVIAQVTGTKFSNVKIVIDVVLVLLSAGFAWLSFRSFFGDGADIVIREGTLILALLTGLCMKLTDPIVDRLFFPILKKADE